jgi:hypothetical protein
MFPLELLGRKRAFRGLKKVLIIVCLISLTRMIIIQVNCLPLRV